MQLDEARRAAITALENDSNKLGHLNWNKAQQFYFTKERTPSSVAYISGEGRIAPYSPVGWWKLDGEK